MNKTLKRRVFRHTALYAAILMFSHTGGGGGGFAQIPHFSIIPDNSTHPEANRGAQYKQ
ncbi:hypothetical protein [Neisseria gonorrhoeae]|uniref:hypothetical protein n=1 Tax=Neisseria gonorrhoeae TaxID=485 RepID=UPI001484F0A7|nr:hypothetical protein [Neisseria gonorrhoeae]